MILHPSIQRKVIFFFMFMGYAMYYFSRKTLVVAMAVLLADPDMNISVTNLGSCATSFAICYGVSKFVAGVLSDVVSARLLFSVGLCISGAMNVFMANLSNGDIYIMSLLWGCNGFFQGFGWPSIGKLIYVWYLKEDRGFWWALCSVSGNVGAALSPSLIGSLVVVFGWRIMFMTIGALSIFVAMLFFVFVLDEPSKSFTQTMPKWRIDTSNEKGDSESFSMSDRLWYLLRLMGNPVFIVVGITYAIVYFIKTAFSDWCALFLLETYELNAVKSGIVLGTVEIGGIFGSIVAGWSADGLTKTALARRLGSGTTRTIVIIPCVVLVYFSLVVLRNLPDFGNDTTLIRQLSLIAFGVGFGVFGPITLYGITIAEIAPTWCAGTARAFIGAVGQIGGAGGGYPYSVLVRLKGWLAAHYFLEQCSIGVIILVSVVTAQQWIVGADGRNMRRKP